MVYGMLLRIKKIKTYIDVVVYTIIEYECDKLLLLFTAA